MVRLLQWSIVLPTAALLTKLTASSDFVSLTFRNELPEDVIVHWEGGAGPSTNEADRYVQGEVGASGGEMTIQTYHGHLFSYDCGNMRHFISAPSDTSEVFVVLLGEASEVPVRCLTTADGGTERDEFIVLVRPDWSPRGAARFLDLVRAGYYDGAALNRVVPGFLTQFGISADFKMRTEWGDSVIPDDPKPTDPPVPFRPGMLSYAGSGPDSRTTEIFVVMPETDPETLEYFGENPWEVPFGIIQGDVAASPVARWYSYGDMPPWGSGPESERIYMEDGYQYLAQEYPRLDYVERCLILDPWESSETEEEL